jgi:hypothetical protein
LSCARTATCRLPSGREGGAVQLFGWILFFAGFIPLVYAMWKKITNGRVFALYFVATAIIVITGIVLTFM